MRIASGSALFVACLVVASSANGKSENTSVTVPPERGGRKVASLGTRKKRGLYGDLSIDDGAENVQIRKVTPVLDPLPSRLESSGQGSTSDLPQELLEDFLHTSTGNLSETLEDSCTLAAPLTPPSKQPKTPQVRGCSDRFAFPSDVCSLEPSTGVHVYPPLYSGPPSTPVMGTAAVTLSNPPLSRALAHCSTSLFIWCSENQEAASLINPPGIYAKSPTTPHHDFVPSKTHSPGEALMSPRADQDDGTCECQDGLNSSIRTHIADGGWVSNLVQTLSS